MATGGILLNNEAFVRKILTSQAFMNVIGGDMEAWGLVTAFQNCYNKGVHFQWIVVKGICDWGFGKTDGYQPLAAAAAANLVSKVLNRKGIRAALEV